ncbi:MAG TPA: translation initiation factor IF-2 subunit alpha [Thermoplasmatales archaeon]|nr:translation initiation factor IF-2 subunit alpha [Thermoplasmatales archaeon]
MLKREGFPEEGDLVVCRVKSIQNFGAFVELEEYPGKEGFIHISEVAPGWIKRIRDHIKENQRIVCKVMQVDRRKGHIDLSLKRVNEHQRREKIQEWKNEQKAWKLLEIVAERMGKSIEECYEEFAKDLIDKYGTLYAAFEECAYDPETLKKDGFSGEWFKHFEEVARENIQIPFVTIKGYLKITSFRPDGVEHVKKALQLSEESNYEDVTIEVTYRGAPFYNIVVRAPDYKVAEDELKKAVERAREYIKKYDGECEFTREIEKK